MERFVAAQPGEAFRGRGESGHLRFAGCRALLRAILDVSRVAFPALIAWSCSAAPPLELGSDEFVFPESEMETVGPPANAFEPEDTELLQDAFMGGASGACEASFQPCGGQLQGTSWMIVDTCTSLTRRNDAAQLEASELLGLDPEACNDVVQSLTTKWAGELVFGERQATDVRLRQRRFDIAVGSKCFNATFGVDASKAELNTFCAMLGEAAGADSANCVPSVNGCRCNALTTTLINRQGLFGIVDGYRASVTGTQYQYCVQGNRLMWGEPHTNWHVVMRRRDPADLGPVETPEIPR